MFLKIPFSPVPGNILMILNVFSVEQEVCAQALGKINGELS